MLVPPPWLPSWQSQYSFSLPLLVITSQYVYEQVNGQYLYTLTALVAHSLLCIKLLHVIGIFLSSFNKFLDKKS